MVSEGTDSTVTGITGRGESNVNDFTTTEERSERLEERSEDRTSLPKSGANNSLLNPHFYTGAQGLAADVRYYGNWMREEAFKRIGHLYPKVHLPQEYGGGEATVIANSDALCVF
jgi:hypothetical protein